jgi:gliding motility-associated-like protein
VNFETSAQLIAQPVLTTTAGTNSPVGQYSIFVGGASSPNYTITAIPGILTISPANEAIVIPNAFTPNGDGVNDTWNIQYLSAYLNCRVDVFNRYGEKVYSSIGYGTPWDGSYRGASLPVGTYYYIISLNNGLKALSGYVAIIR